MGQEYKLFVHLCSSGAFEWDNKFVECVILFMHKLYRAATEKH